MALMASGLNGQNFAFNGYLPIDNSERKKVDKLEIQNGISVFQTLYSVVR